jgi:hypothetical protein
MGVIVRQTRRPVGEVPVMARAPMSRKGGETGPVKWPSSWSLRPPLGKAPRSGAPRFKSNPRDKGRATRPTAIKIFFFAQSLSLKTSRNWAKLTLN